MVSLNIKINLLALIIEGVLVLGHPLQASAQVLVLEQLLKLPAIARLVKQQLKLEPVECIVGHQVLGRVGVVAGRWEEGVKAQPQRVLQHVGDDATQQTRAYLQAGVCVDLDQPGVEAGVEHEVQSEHFPVVVEASGVQGPVAGLKGVQGNLLDTGVKLAHQRVLAGGVGHVDVPLQLGVRDFVALLVLPIVLGVFLNGVVCEVHFYVANIAKVKHRRGCAHVALPVEVQPHPAVQSGHQHIVANVELPALIQQRVLDILLYDECVLFSFAVLRPTDYLVNLVQLIANVDSIAPIAVLAGLHYPNILVMLLHLQFVVVIGKLLVGRVSQALLLYMEGQGNDFEYVFIYEFAVSLQVKKQRFLVADVVVECKMIMNSQVSTLGSFQGCLLEVSSPRLIVLILLRVRLSFLEELAVLYKLILCHDFQQYIFWKHWLVCAALRIRTLLLPVNHNFLFFVKTCSNSLVRLLELKNLMNFELSPHKVGLLYVVNLTPPKSSLHQTQDQLPVVAPAHVELVLLLVLEAPIGQDQGVEYLMGQIDLKQKLPIVLDFVVINRNFTISCVEEVPFLAALRREVLLSRLLGFKVPGLFEQYLRNLSMPFRDMRASFY